MDSVNSAAEANKGLATEILRNEVENKYGD
jgi:hypothetical protein